MRMAIGLPPGEIVDRLGILELKKKFGASKLSVEKKLHLDDDIILYSAAERVLYRRLTVDSRNAYNSYVNELHNCNAMLWDVEDSLRALERDQRFNEDFISLARKVYKYNDQRNHFKNMISALFGENDDVKIYRKEYQ